MAMRIYRVVNTDTAAEYLVRAQSQAQAIRHVVKETYRAAVAAQETLVDLLSAGVKVQDASASADVPPVFENDYDYDDEEEAKEA